MNTSFCGMVFSLSPFEKEGLVSNSVVSFPLAIERYGLESVSLDLLDGIFDFDNYLEERPVTLEGSCEIFAHDATVISFFGDSGGEEILADIRAKCRTNYSFGEPRAYDNRPFRDSRFAALTQQRMRDTRSTEKNLLGMKR